MDAPIPLTSQLREHLRALRKARGLTQVALGRLLGVGQARVAEIERNPGAVSVDQLMKVLSALRVSLVLRDGMLAVPAELPDTTGQLPSAPSDAQTLRDANPHLDVKPTSRRNFVIRPKKGSW